MSSFPKHLYLAKENSFDDTSSDEEVTPKSYQKIQTIWKDLRQSKNLSGALKLNRTYDAKENVITPQETKLTSDKGLKLERQLALLQNELVLTNKKLNDAEKEVERCHTKIARQLNVSALQSNELDELNIKYDNLNTLYQQNTQKAENELAEKDREIANLKKELQEKRDNIWTNSIKLDEQNSKIIALEQEIRSLNHENTLLKKKPNQISHSYLRESHSRTQSGSINNEVEKLKFEVKRLAKLLRTTKEFKDFAEFSLEGISNNATLKSNKHSRAQSTDYNRTSVVPASHASQTIDKHQFMGTNKYIPKKEKIIYEQFSKAFEQSILKNQGTLGRNSIQDLVTQFTEIWNKNKPGKNIFLNKNIDEHPQSEKYNIPPSVRITTENKNHEKSKDHPISEPSVFASIHTSQFNTQRKSHDNLLQGAEDEIIHYCESLRRKIEEIINEFKRKRKELIDRYNWSSEIGTMCRKEDWLLENIETILSDFNKGLIQRLKGKSKMPTPRQLNISVL